MISGRGVFVAAIYGALMMTAGLVRPLDAQTGPGGQGNPACGADVVKSLAGTWKAPQYKMKRASEVGARVFGPNALDVRDVELALQPSGEGVLKISTSVQDEKGRTWAPTLVEVKVTVGPSTTVTAGRCEPVVTVVAAEERYLDETKLVVPMAGVGVRLLNGPARNEAEVRFQTAKGEGSFWSSLRR